MDLRFGQKADEVDVAAIEYMEYLLPRDVIAGKWTIVLQKPHQRRTDKLHAVAQETDLVPEQRRLEYLRPHGEILDGIAEPSQIFGVVNAGILHLRANAIDKNPYRSVGQLPTYARQRFPDDVD